MEDDGGPARPELVTWSEVGPLAAQGPPREPSEVWRLVADAIENELLLPIGEPPDVELVIGGSVFPYCIQDGPPSAIRRVRFDRRELCAALGIPSAPADPAGEIERRPATSGRAGRQTKEATAEILGFVAARLADQGSPKTTWGEVKSWLLDARSEDGSMIQRSVAERLARAIIKGWRRF